MRSVSPYIYLAAIAAVWVGISCWGTLVLARQPDVPRLQRAGQLILIWALPILGALLVAELYGALRRRRLSAPNADEMNPLLNQALQPLARLETRAAISFIEKEVGDVVEHHFDGHSGGGGEGHQ
jgi:hypothetical protein